MPSKRSSENALDVKSDLLFDLANTEQNGIRVFRRKWNRLYRQYSDTDLLIFRDELRVLWGSVAPMDEAEWADQPADVTWEDFSSGMTAHQKRLYKAYWKGPWRASANGSLETMICQRWLNLEKGGIVVDWTPERKRLRADPANLPVVLVLACLRHAEHLGICRNPECANRYFIASRNDQRYCSPECAQPAKKAAKLKWWHEHKGKNDLGRKSAVKAKQTKEKG